MYNVGEAKDQLLLLLPQDEPTEAVKQLRKKFPQIDIIFHEVSFTFDLDKIASELPDGIWDDATILCTLAAFPKKIEQAPKLDFVQLLSAGSNQIQKNPIYTDSKIPIATATGIHGPQIAEWVIMTALVQSHDYKRLYEHQKKHEWGKNMSQDLNSVGRTSVVDRGTAATEACDQRSATLGGAKGLTKR